MSFKEYASYDGLGLSELVRKGDVKPLELVEEAIRRIERHNPALNAVIYKIYDRALNEWEADAGGEILFFNYIKNLLLEVMFVICDYI